MEELAKTESVCPECLKIVPATVFGRDGRVWIKKTCSDHGEFEELYFGSMKWYERAKRYARDGKGVENPQVTKSDPVCPKDCGLCTMHKSHTALANIVVTNRCDLACWYCFFYSGRAGYIYEPTIDQIEEMVETLRDERPIPCNAVQITGGEPCLREDIVEIIKLIKKHKIDHIQLNTNGIRLSHDPELLRRVREAGVNTLYLSFDGLTEKSNPKNHWEVPYLLEHCKSAGMGVVLVPTVIRSVNDDEIGDIVRFGLKNIDVVRGVNFQPVSLVGRMPREEREKYRITIPDVLGKLEEQTGGEISVEDFFPVPAAMVISGFLEAFTGKTMYDMSSHFACGAATYLFKDGERVIPITRFIDVEGFLEYLDEKADELRRGKGRALVGMKILSSIGKFIDKKNKPKDLDVGRLILDVIIRHNYDALGKFHMKTLFIGMMHFMDLYNYDIERVKRCCIHYVMTDKRVVPFCAFNVIPDWYRDRDQKSQGISFDEWEKKTGKSLKSDLYRRDIERLKDGEEYRKFIQQVREIKKEA
ncbi:MAG: radical SAM protein [Candidatus Hadarchaeales archaeon]